jgi:hypothetical protein
MQNSLAAQPIKSRPLRAEAAEREPVQQNKKARSPWLSKMRQITATLFTARNDRALYK